MNVCGIFIVVFVAMCGGTAVRRTYQCPKVRSVAFEAELDVLRTHKNASLNLISLIVSESHRHARLAQQSNISLSMRRYHQGYAYITRETQYIVKRRATALFYYFHHLRCVASFGRARHLCIAGDNCDRDCRINKTRVIASARQAMKDYVRPMMYQAGNCSQKITTWMQEYQSTSLYGDICENRRSRLSCVGIFLLDYIRQLTVG